MSKTHSNFNLQNVGQPFWHAFLIIPMPNIDVEQCDAEIFIYLRKRGLTFPILKFQNSNNQRRTL